MLIINVSYKKVVLKYMFYIYYFVQFYDNKILVLFDNKSEINIINSNYV